MAAGALSVMFWNMQNWGERYSEPYEAARLKRIVDVLKEEDPDIVSFAEVSDDEISAKLAAMLPPGYTIHQTASINHLRILTIFKNAATYNVSITQRDEFKGPEQKWRPYPLINVQTATESIQILPIHTKSGNKQENLKSRNNTMDGVFAVAQEVHNAGASFITLGDMNTMGGGTITAQKEISDLSGAAWRDGKLLLMNKDQPYTWHGIGFDAKYPDSELDHVMMTPALIKRLVPVNAKGDLIKVGGWPTLPPGAARDKWVEDFSDHAYVKFTLRI